MNKFICSDCNRELIGICHCHTCHLKKQNNSNDELDVNTVKEIIKLLQKRVDGFWTDLKVGHIQRVVEGIDVKYIDENQALIVVDHLMRLRCYQEMIADLNLKLAEQEGLK